MGRKSKLSKLLIDLLAFVFLVFVFFFFNLQSAQAAPIVKAYLVVSEDWKERVADDIPRLKQNILNGLNKTQSFYSSKLDGDTFPYDTNVEVVYAQGSIDESRVHYCVSDYVKRIFNSEGELTVPLNVVYSPAGEIHALFVVGTKNAANCAETSTYIGRPGTAYFTHQVIEELGSSEDFFKIFSVVVLSHELGHTFGLTYSDYALSHPCSVFSKDQCQRDVGTASKPYPPGDECLKSVMGLGYCRNEGGKGIPIKQETLENMGFDNSVWNPEIKILLKALGASSIPTQTPIPIPTPTPFSVSPSPTITASPTPIITPSPPPFQNPTSTPVPGVTQIIVSNYKDFGLNSPGDNGSLTQTFNSQSPTPIIWKKSTLIPKSPIYVGPVNSDGTSGEISEVYLSDGQQYQVSNSQFVIQAKVEKKVAAVKINNEDISFPFTIPFNIHLPGTEGVVDNYSVPVIITYNDGSSKSLLFTFIYKANNPTPSPSSVTPVPTPSIPPSASPSLSSDEILCQARGGVCQASCTGEFSSQVGACSDTTICCSKPVSTSPTGSKCPGNYPVNFEWGGPCRLGETDVALPSNGNTACSIASCYFKQDINEYCWYNSGESYADYEGCKAKGVIIGADYGREK